MNIFILDESPILAAQYHCDVHINKMIIESCQMLSTTIRYMNDPVGRTVRIPDKPKAKHLHVAPGDVIVDGYLVERRFMLNTHLNHPCTAWLRESVDNMSWLHSLTISLNTIWEAKSGKRHNSFDKLNLQVSDYANLKYPDTGFTKPARAMPIVYWRKSVVESYREYYKAKLSEWLATPGKERYASYANRNIPEWLKPIYPVERRANHVNQAYKYAVKQDPRTRNTRH